MSIKLDLQYACDQQDVPSEQEFSEWIAAIPLLDHHQDGQQGHREVVIRIVDAEEMQALNQRYRQQNKTTNVLSFVAEMPDIVDDPLLGDVIICASVVKNEALEQHKCISSHWAHMVVHGILHLLGYDHIESADARIMEQLEIQILQTLSINNPYIEKTS